jgi:hypothetical protein
LQTLNDNDLNLDLASDSSLSLGSVRSSYLEGFITEGKALSFYQAWVKEPLWLALSMPNLSCPVPPEFGRIYRRASWEPIYHFFEASKRGNDVYLNRVRKRFFNLSSSCKDNSGIKFLKGRGGFSHLLFVTLTYDTKRCNKISAYGSVGSELNNYLSHLKSKYGRLKVLRCFETFKASGYPHIHMVIEFLDCKFRFRYYTYKDGKTGYIIADNDVRKNIEGYWHSFAKVQGVESVGAVQYLLKYITKEMYSDNFNTVCHLWLYHKHSYSVINGFLDFTFDKLGYQVHTIVHNSNLNFCSSIFLGSFKIDFDLDCHYFVVKKPPPDIDWHISNDCLSGLFSRRFKDFYECRIVE